MYTFGSRGSLLYNLASRLGASSSNARSSARNPRFFGATAPTRVHCVSSDGLTQPYGIPVQLTEDNAPKRIVYFGGVSGCIAAISRFMKSEYYQNNGTRLQVYVDKNWKSTIIPPMDQPWGQEIGSLVPHDRVQARKLYPHKSPTDRLQISELGKLQDAEIRELEYLIGTRGLNIEINQGVLFDRAHCSVEYRSSADEEYQPMIRIQTGDAFKEIPYEGTLVINNAFSYGRLTTGNHDLTDKNGKQLQFMQGTVLFSTPSDKLDSNIASVGFGLTYLWAASKLKKEGVNLICLYDKNFTPFTTVADLVNANAANQWIKELPDDILNSLEVHAIQDCTVKQNTDGKYEVTLPTGEVRNVGNHLYDLTGYTPVNELTQDLPDQVVYRPTEAGIFAFAHDQLRDEINTILDDAGKLPPEDKSKFLQLVSMIERSHMLKEKLRVDNHALTFDQFKEIQQKMMKNHDEIRAFAKDCGGLVLQIFNRYEQDSEKSLFLEHAPKGSAPYTYALSAHQFGHIPNLSVFESHLIRSSHLFEVVRQEFEQYTGLALTTELYDKYLDKLRERAVHAQTAINKMDLGNRVDAFMQAAREIYPDISKEKLYEFCQLQGVYFKNSEKHALGFDDTYIPHKTYTQNEIGQFLETAPKSRVIMSE